MAQNNQALHIAILYVATAVLVIWLAFSQYQFITERSQGEWVCSNVVCSRFVTPEELTSQYCFSVPTDDNATIEVCRVLVDGVEQILPKAQLNITAQCAEYSCTQEIKARKASYMLNATQAQSTP